MTSSPIVEPSTVARQIIDGIPDSVALVDREWRLCYANRQAQERLSALNPALSNNGLGERIWDLAPGLAGTFVEREYRAAMEGRTPRTFELYYAPTEKWYEVRCFPGGPGLMIYSRDITSQKYREQLAELRQEIAALLSHSDPMQRILQGVAEVLVKRLEAAFARVWLLNATTNVLELVASAGLYTHLDGPHGRVPVGQFKIGRIAQSKQPHLTNDVQRDPHVSNQEWARREQMIAFAGYPLLVENRVLGVIALFARRKLSDEVLGDLAPLSASLGQFVERRHYEAALIEQAEKLREHAATLEARVAERTARLQESVDSLERFTYSIAHDLRAPLRGMAGLSYALMNDYRSVLDSNAMDYAKRIITSAQRMDSLIQDLLGYARLTQVEVPATELALEEVLHETIAQLEAEIENSGAQIELLRPLGTICTNSAVLEQILLNLIGNALKFVAPGVTPNVQIWTEKTKEQTVIHVKDNGIGIAEEHHQKIFRVFERLHDHKKYSGTGIGLAIVQKGVERLGGSVSVNSKEGAGSVFSIKLPSEGLKKSINE